MSETNYTLEPIRPQDWEPVRQWRNAQMDILRQNEPINKEQQKNYAKLYYSFPSLTLLYSFLLDNELIGYGGLAKIDWENNRAETSFLLNPERVKDNDLYLKEFIIFHEMLRWYTKKMNLHKWCAETFEFRTWHIHCMEKFGFQYEGRLVDAVRKNGRYVDCILHGKIWD